MTDTKQTLFAPVRGWIDAWYDSAHAVPILLALFVIAWTAFQVISFAPVGLHPDVVEVYDWGRHPAAGYYKHPPLGGLMSGAWFAVFPAADWSAHLMAMVNAALSLFFVDLIARRFLGHDKRLMVLLLLMITPFYQFHAVRFASNQTLLLTWPLAVYCFIGAFKDRGILWGAAAGATAALAMLGKYFSIYLVAGIAIAALAHPDRLRYLRSPSPWVSIGVGFAVLAPHLRWLMETGYQPFAYAIAVHGAPSWLAAAQTVPGYLLGSLGYMLIPVAVWALATRPQPADLLAALWPRDSDCRMLATLLWAPIVLPAISAPFIGVELTSIWTMQAWFLLPILLLLPERIVLRRDAAISVAAGVAVFTLAALLVSPALAWLKHRQGTSEDRAYFSPVAQELTRRWREVSGRPLSIVLGELSIETSFYSSDHPDAVPGFSLSVAPWVTPGRMAREGFAVICRDEGCAAHALQLAAGHLGVPSAPKHFVLVLAPPRQAGQ
jgi:4-amino-4-deoxy-L-arabinose transferase-like glycosyltransferase